ncbi:MAG: endoplasmic oxidoreductin-1 [Pleopsidium flavum]|nr:MAG: endoplasmic oxidoreductin-1 [Pleopsidium flavum]
MRSATQLFYLAVFALLEPSHAGSHSGTRSKANSAEICGIEPKAIVSDACASYNTLDSLNTALSPSLKSITQTTDFFAYYRLNLFNRVCPFWNDANSMCGNIACAVNTLDNEDDVPLIWRAEELGKLEGPKAGHPGRKLQQERGAEKPLLGMLGEDVGESCVVEYDDECDERDYCVPEDESATAKGDYVSLVDNPERFTGYTGESAHQVWDAIYRENCFSREPAYSSGKTGRSSSFDSGSQAARDLRSVIQANSASTDLPLDDECLEKRVFYRVISGMHASISSHLCWDYLNQTTGNWGPNIQCYEERLANHPERVSNLYFNYALVLRAVGKLRTYLKNYTFCSGDPRQDFETKQKVLRLADKAASGPAIFDESLMFRDPSVFGLKEDFRNRFRNVSRMMDCVGCDKCRLWGKLQTVGYGTALKVLFEYDENKNGENPPLRRTELVALVNTLDRISSSLTAIGKFKAMMAAREDGQLMSQGERRQYAAEEERVVLGGEVPLMEDEDEEAYDIPDAQSSLMDDILDEWYLVWRTFAYVLRSWVQLPGRMWVAPSCSSLRTVFLAGLTVRADGQFSFSNSIDFGTSGLDFR